MEPILGDVFTWSWFSEPHGYNFNSLVIPDLDGNICIDPVEPNDQVMSELVQTGVDSILLTNRNHVRAQIGFASTPAPGATSILKTPHTRKGRAPCSTVNFRTAKQSGRSR